MADLAIPAPAMKGLLSLEKKVLASRVLELHSELARERVRREAAEGTVWRAPETAKPGQSLILSAPWPARGEFRGPFRGEGYRDRVDGTWRWANGKPVGRPVTHVADLPMPPPARESMPDAPPAKRGQPD
jgi:hypothetical protein